MGKEDYPLFLFHMKKEAIRASETLFLQLQLCQENTFQYKLTADNSSISQAIRRAVSVNNVIDVRFTANWGTAAAVVLQIGRSLVRSQLVSVDFSLT